MENLNIEATEYTPNIVLDADKGLIEIRGDSFPENTYDFYKPVTEWLKEYFNSNAKDKTIINMEINYFNSSSSQLFFDLFDLFEEVSESNNLEINWLYDEKNDSAEEAGEDFVEEFETLNINMVVK